MENFDLSTILLIFAGVNLLALGTVFLPRVYKWVKQRKINHYGDAAERRVADYLKKNFPKAKVFNNVYLETHRGLTQLDHILIIEKGIFVIETKSHHGRIVTNQRNWTQIYGEKVVSFHSPIRQNKIHIEALKNALMKDNSLSVDRIPIYGVTVFTARDVEFSHNVEHVVRLNDLKRYIYTRRSPKIPRHLLPKISRTLSRSFVKSKIRQNNHRKQIQEENNKRNEKRYYKYKK